MSLFLNRVIRATLNSGQRLFADISGGDRGRGRRRESLTGDQKRIPITYADGKRIGWETDDTCKLHKLCRLRTHR